MIYSLPPSIFPSLDCSSSRGRDWEEESERCQRVSHVPDCLFVVGGAPNLTQVQAGFISCLWSSGSEVQAIPGGDIWLYHGSLLC